MRWSGVGDIGPFSPLPPNVLKVGDEIVDIGIGTCFFFSGGQRLRR
jgi:hypothetical protein